MEPYDVTMERINKKRFKKYEYKINEREEKLSIIYSHCLIMKQIYENIWRKEQEGINQNSVKMELYEFFQKTQTRGNLANFEMLFAEANAQLGLLRLPSEFIKYKELIHR